MTIAENIKTHSKKIGAAVTKGGKRVTDSIINGSIDVSDAVKKQITKRIMQVLTSSVVSDKDLVYLISLAEKFFIRDKKTKKQAKAIKKAMSENHPTFRLVRDTFARLSPKCKEKLIENFFINSTIFGTKKQNRKEQELGHGLPWHFVISPTAKCNLNCVGCYAYEYSKNEGLSFELVDRILQEAKDLGIYFIVVSGGEPFVWPHLFKMFEKHNDMYFQIYTNGTLITKEVAKKLAEVGNAAPAISIEGFETETDRRRGPGIFNKVMEAMDNLREAGVLFGFSVTPTKLNTEILMSDQFIDLVIKKGASFGWFFQYVPIGKTPDVDLMATPEQRTALRKRVREIRDTKPIFVGDFWNDGPYVQGCIAGARSGGYFHINCNGDVEPCVFLQFSVDNIKDKKLLEVIQSDFFKAIQKSQPYCSNKNLLMPCALIDNPQVLRELVKKYNAKPSYGTYETTTNPKICKFLDDYSKRMHELTDKDWEEMKKKHKFKHWKETFKLKK